MIGAAGVSAVPDSARVVQNMGLKNDPTNYLLMHAMAPNVSGVIGSAVGAGPFLSFLSIYRYSIKNSLFDHGVFYYPFLYFLFQKNT